MKTYTVNITDEVDALNAFGANLRAFGAGDGAGEDPSFVDEPDRDAVDLELGRVADLGVRDEPADALVAHVTKQLSPHKRPRAVHFLAELPRNAMGKVQKKLLGG